MRRPKVPILFFVVILLAGACGDDGGESPDGTTGPTVTTAPDEGLDLVGAARLSADRTEARVGIGDLVVVGLPENPSVGDNWQFAQEPDGDVLDLVDERYEADDPGLLGAGGIVSFVLEAVGDGSTTFVLENCYRCNSDGEPSEAPPEPGAIEFSVEVTP